MTTFEQNIVDGTHCSECGKYIDSTKGGCRTCNSCIYDNVFDADVECKDEKLSYRGLIEGQDFDVDAYYMFK